MKVSFTVNAERDLKRLGKNTAERIAQKLNWFSVNFEDEIPQPLGGSYKGFYKLRVGDWRVIYEIDYRLEEIIVHLVDHRSKIYKR